MLVIFLSHASHSSVQSRVLFITPHWLLIQSLSSSVNLTFFFSPQNQNQFVLVQPTKQRTSGYIIILSDIYYLFWRYALLTIYKRYSFKLCRVLQSLELDKNHGGVGGSWDLGRGLGGEKEAPRGYRAVCGRDGLWKSYWLLGGRLMASPLVKEHKFGG